MTGVSQIKKYYMYVDSVSRAGYAKYRIIVAVPVLSIASLWQSRCTRTKLGLTTCRRDMMCDVKRPGHILVTITKHSVIYVPNL